jgi:hypothetical protein
MGIGDDAVPVKFGVDEAHSRGADVLIGVEEIATDGHSDAPLFGFSWAVGTDELGVGDFSAGRNLVREDKKHSVVAADLFTDGAIEMKTLGAASPFIGEGLVPSFGVGAVEKRVDVFSLARDGIVHFAGNGGIVSDQLD